MTQDEVLSDARHQVAAYLRQCPSEGALWEGPEGSGQGSYQPDDAGRRAACQFARALEIIAGELEQRAEADDARAALAGQARAARRMEREDAEREARLASEITETQERYRRLLAGE
jgi:hypothetical protein